MNFGKNIRLTRAEIERAIRIHAHDIAKSRGHTPESSNLFDFLDRTQLHWNLLSVQPQKEGDPSVVVGDVYITLDE